MYDRRAESSMLYSALKQPAPLTASGAECFASELQRRHEAGSARFGGSGRMSRSNDQGHQSGLAVLKKELNPMGAGTTGGEEKRRRKSKCP